jgi:Zn ribbon nucleic-acid-binding protein
MSFYYCPTCQRTLAENEVRRNKIFVPKKQEPYGFIHLQNSPLTIGVPLGSSGADTIEVLRCVNCGSDAKFAGYTDDERKYMQESEKQLKEKIKKDDAEARRIVLGILFVIGVVIFFVLAIKYDW